MAVGTEPGIQGPFPSVAGTAWAWCWGQGMALPPGPALDLLWLSDGQCPASSLESDWSPSRRDPCSTLDMQWAEGTGGALCQKPGGRGHDPSCAATYRQRHSTASAGSAALQGWCSLRTYGDSEFPASCCGPWPGAQSPAPHPGRRGRARRPGSLVVPPWVSDPRLLPGDGPFATKLAAGPRSRAPGGPCATRTCYTVCS